MDRNNGYTVELFKNSVISKSENLEITQPLPRTMEQLKQFFDTFKIDCVETNVPKNQEEYSLLLQKYGIEHEFFNADLFDTKLEKQKDGTWKRIIKN